MLVTQKHLQANHRRDCETAPLIWLLNTNITSKSCGSKTFTFLYSLPQPRHDLIVKMLLGNSTSTCCVRSTEDVMMVHGCIVFGCRVLCGWGLTLTLSQSFTCCLPGRTGKMVKKVCPCNQLCSNYLSFWSSLPAILPAILTLALPCRPPHPPAP